MRRLAALAWLGVCLGCSGPAPAREQSLPPSAASADEAAPQNIAADTAAASPGRPLEQPPPSAARAPAAPLLRVATRAGAAGEVVVEGVGQRLWTGRDGALAFDLPNGARIELQRNSQAFVPAFEPSSVLLLSGALYVALAPAGNQPGRAGLRVALAGATLRVPVAGETFLAQRVCPAAGDALALQAFAVQLRGGAELLRLEGEDVRDESLSAGQGFARGLAKAPAFAAITTLSQAQKLSAAALSRCQRPEPLPDADARLTLAITALQQAAEQGRTLLKRVAAGALKQGAVRAAGVDAGLGQALQRDRSALVAQAQRKSEQRQLLLTAAEQSLLAAASTCAPGPEACAALERWKASYVLQLTAAL